MSALVFSNNCGTAANTIGSFDITLNVKSNEEAYLRAAPPGPLSKEAWRLKITLTEADGSPLIGDLIPFDDLVVVFLLTSADPPFPVSHVFSARVKTVGSPINELPVDAIFQVLCFQGCEHQPLAEVSLLHIYYGINQLNKEYAIRFQGEGIGILSLPLNLPSLFSA